MKKIIILLKQNYLKSMLLLLVFSIIGIVSILDYPILVINVRNANENLIHFLLNNFSNLSNILSFIGLFTGGFVIYRFVIDIFRPTISIDKSITVEINEKRYLISNRFKKRNNNIDTSKNVLNPNKNDESSILVQDFRRYEQNYVILTMLVALIGAFLMHRYNIGNYIYPSVLFILSALYHALTIFRVKTDRFGTNFGEVKELLAYLRFLDKSGKPPPDQTGLREPNIAHNRSAYNQSNGQPVGDAS